MIMPNMCGSFFALLFILKIQVQTAKLRHDNPYSPMAKVAEVGENTAEYQEYRRLSRLVSMMEMRLEDAERSLLELKDVKGKVITQANELKAVKEEAARQAMELKDVKERLSHTDQRRKELEEFVKTNIANCHVLSEPFYDEERNYQIDKNDGESNLHVLSDGMDPIKKPNTAKILEHKKENFHSVKRAITTRTAAFTVSLRNILTSINIGQIVPFDTVLFNEGNMYNSQSHLVTCPVSGTYVFTLSAACKTSYHIYLRLIVDGDVKANVAATGSNQGSSTIVLRCEAGQNVWASVYEGTFLNGDLFTSIAGFLLWPDTATTATSSQFSRNV